MIVRPFLTVTERELMEIHSEERNIMTAAHAGQISNSMKMFYLYLSLTVKQQQHFFCHKFA